MKSSKSPDPEAGQLAAVLQQLRRQVEQLKEWNRAFGELLQRVPAPRFDPASGEPLNPAGELANMIQAVQELCVPPLIEALTTALLSALGKGAPRMTEPKCLDAREN